MKKEAIENHLIHSQFSASAIQIVIKVLNPGAAGRIEYAQQLLNDENDNNKLNEIIRGLINLSRGRLNKHLNRRNMSEIEAFSYEVQGVAPLSEAEINAERGLIALLENVLRPVS